MNKKGQFFIIIAIFLALVIFGLSLQPNKLRQDLPLYDFSSLSDNYIEESPKVVNYAIYNKKNVTEVLPEFTQDFIQYAHSINPSLGLVYVYNDNNAILVENYLNETSITLRTQNTSQELFNSQFAVVNEVSITVAGKRYIHSVPVNLKNFDKSYSTFQTGESLNWIDLEVSGVVHRFDVSQSTPRLVILLKASNDQITEIQLSK